jgi:lysophospholipid acyltransferase (LPLAT)-like uncharacterized protein
VKERLIDLLLKLVFLIYPLTYRTRWVNVPSPLENQPAVYAHYHGHELVLIPAMRHQGLMTLSSLSRDGRRMARLLRFFGYTVIDGSSSRRGVQGLVELKRRLDKHPRPVSFAVDGPRGPLHEAKPGVIWLSQKTGLPLRLVSVHVTRAWVLRKSWNQALIPKPFSTVTLCCSDEVFLDTAMRPSELSQGLTRQLKEFQSRNQN